MLTVDWLFLDMNSFFASVEQHLQPALRGRPVAVVPMMTDRTCCIAVSYEARRFGIKTGTNVGEARRRCPGLRLVEGRPESRGSSAARNLASQVLPLLRPVRSKQILTCAELPRVPNYP